MKPQNNKKAITKAIRSLDKTIKALDRLQENTAAKSFERDIFQLTKLKDVLTTRLIKLTIPSAKGIVFTFKSL